MVFNNIPDPVEDTGFTSRFNEAFLKMHRLHKLQDSIIQANFNLQFYNPVVQVYNYQIVLSCCNGLLYEVWGKLTKEEREEAKKRKDAINNFLKKHPIHCQTKNQTTNKPNTTFNSSNWEIFSNYLEEYNFYIRELISRTGYDSPNLDDDFEGL